MSATLDRPQMFTSGKDDWETPTGLWLSMHREFGFTLDVAANETNHKGPRWFGPGGLAEDALTQDWRGERCWMNPPYSRGLQAAFIRKAATSGALVVALLPARTDTRAFHDYIYGKAEIRFLRGRVKFVGADSGAPFPSMIVVFNGELR